MENNNDIEVRSFTFYNNRSNNFRNRELNNKSKSMTLGYFDEMNTESVVLKEKNGNMENLWRNINEKNRKLVSDDVDNFTNESFQNIFGYSFYAYGNRAPSMEERADKEFWDKRNDYAYTSVILVQFFDKEVKLEEKINIYKTRIIENVQKYFNDYEKYFLKAPDTKEINSNFIITDYITFDRYDYILAVKANCYLPFVLGIQQLYSLKAEGKCIALNSFTVTALNNVANLSNEVIPSICIKCNYDENNIYKYNKANRFSRFDVFQYLEWFKGRLCEVLYEKKEKDLDYRLYYISGEDDVRIIARKVETRNLFSLFWNNNLLKTEYLCGFSTAINVVANENNIQDNEFIFNFQWKNCTIEEKLVSLRKNIDGLAKKRDVLSGQKQYPEELIKTLHQINSGLSGIKPDDPSYRCYGFYSLYSNFEGFVDLLNHYEGTIDQKFLSDAFKVTKCLGAALLTTVRSDFREFQIATFNANLYYAPTKLLVFYRAYIYQVVQLFQCYQPGSTEHFIINTGNRSETVVEENFNYAYEEDGTVKKIKFFICSMSEKNIYLLKNSMFELTHEVAHHGLKVVRNREKRQEFILDSYIRSFFVVLKTVLTNELLCTVDIAEQSSELNLEVYKYINESDMYKDIRRIIIDHYEKRGMNEEKQNMHLNESIDYIMEVFQDSFLEVEKFLLKTIVNIMPTDSLNYMDNNELSNIYHIVVEEREKYIRNTTHVVRELLLNGMVDQINRVPYLLKDYFKETFADAIAIAALNISLDDYVGFWNEIGFHDSTAMYRIYIVYTACKDWYNKKKNSSAVLVKDKYFIEKYNQFLREQKDACITDWTEDELDENIFDLKHFFFREKGIFNNFVQYIKECLTNYDEYAGKEKEALLGEYSPDKIFFNLTDTRKDLGNKILYMDMVLSDYEEKFC